MATRRTTINVPIPSSPQIPRNESTPSTRPQSGMTQISAPASSPWLPTPLEAILFSIYPGTLIFGSLFSTITVNAKESPYNFISQSYAPEHAPSYFAKKSNVFNVYFVKKGWLWITIAFLLFTFTHSSLGPKLTVTRRRAQALARYAIITSVWIGVTQWFFGPALIDRGFRLTGGQCAIMLSDSPGAQAMKAEMSDFREALTQRACKSHGGQWAGGHDISGHVFLLIVGSAMLWFEMLPAIFRLPGLREARRIMTADGLVRSAAVERQNESESDGKGIKVPQEVAGGVQVAVLVAGASMWMLLMTAAYFHTWFEKFTGFLVASSVLYVVYFLPRAVPVLRGVLGMPGV